MNNTDNKEIQISDSNKTHENDGIEFLDLDTLNLEEPEEVITPVQPPSNIREDSSVGTWIRRIIMVVSALVFLFSAGMLIHIFLEYGKADTIYNDVANSVFTPVQSTPKETAAPIVDDKGNVVATAAPNNSTAEFTYNHEALVAINKDSVGYMLIPSIGISLPVVQGSDNDFYLSHAVNGEYSGNGTLFIDYRIPEGLENSNAIIYGHCMKNGAMFGSLYKLKNPNFTNSGDNDLIYIYTGKVMHTYKIYSVHETPAISVAYSIDFPDDETFLAYTGEMASQSLFNRNIPINPGDKTLTLSTCTNNDDIRLVVHAVRISTTPLE